MTKDEKRYKQEWERYLALVNLTAKVGRDLENDGENAGDGSDDGACSEQTLLLKDFLESASVYYYPSFVGYVVAAWNLLKQAFCNKKRKNLLLICRPWRTE